MNGKKYAVLKNSLPLILLFSTAARITGITTAIRVTEIAKTNVFFNIRAKFGLVSSSK